MVFELTPPGAAVFMQGRRLTERVVEVNGGQTYRMEIRAPGFDPCPLVVAPTAGEHRVIHVDLTKKGFW